MEVAIEKKQKQRSRKQLSNILGEATKKVAPVWPLESFVAVNPYLGFTGQRFEDTAQLLADIGGISMTMPASFYKRKLAEGRISRKDLEEALAKKTLLDTSVDDFLTLLEENDGHRQEHTVKACMDVATDLTDRDWKFFATARISNWAASYFDKGQAPWDVSQKNLSPFAAWKAEASVDRTTEIAGLKDFRKYVKELPEDAIEAVNVALSKLELSDDMLADYLHRLLIIVGGWSAHAARLDWDQGLRNRESSVLLEFLAILISWDACLFRSLESPALRMKWNENLNYLSTVKAGSETKVEVAQRLILQEAFDLALQRELLQEFNNQKAEIKNEDETIAKAVFCIDVRSEVYRRNLEEASARIKTIGFAGFFGFPIEYIPLSQQEGRAQCPVLLAPAVKIKEEIPEMSKNESVLRKRKVSYQLQKVWKSFKAGAVTCFSFVSPLGMTYLPKLFSDSFGMTRPVEHPDKLGLSAADRRELKVQVREDHRGNESFGISPDDQVQMAKNALKAMTLSDDIPELVLIVGHGSTSVNNPHATGLDCGACGGNTGEANAKVAATILNDSIVRSRLQEEGIDIPERTVFLACLHDTTTDEVSIFNESDVAIDQQEKLAEVKKALEKAGKSSRSERALRMAIEKNVDSAIEKRSNDWSQIRPEWGLAGCSAFVVAPRHRSENIDFGGRSFLHSYEWQKDENFSILELIMTAPMVVTSWINLQYYGSTVDNTFMGAGNKTLHNVTAGIGVLEGYSGDLRVGLPLQSVHDGSEFQHEAVRLKVCIEAPMEAMNEVLKKHENVRDLCDNEWIHLYHINEDGKITHRYSGDLNWQEIKTS